MDRIWVDTCRMWMCGVVSRDTSVVAVSSSGPIERAERAARPTSRWDIHVHVHVSKHDIWLKAPRVQIRTGPRQSMVPRPGCRRTSAEISLYADVGRVRLTADSNGGSGWALAGRRAGCSAQEARASQSSRLGSSCESVVEIETIYAFSDEGRRRRETGHTWIWTALASSTDLQWTSASEDARRGRCGALDSAARGA